MKQIILALSFAVLMGACASTSGPYASPKEPHGIIDLNAPRVQMIPVRLAVLDGKNNLEPARSTFPLTPGEHDLVVTAVDSTFAPTSLQSVTGRVRQADPGKFTITIEAGIRYWIAAEPTDRQGGWKPVIYKETYMDGPNKGKPVPEGN